MKFWSFCDSTSSRVENVVFVKFAFYSVVILTIQKPDSYSALASSLVRVGQSFGNTNTVPY